MVKKKVPEWLNSSMWSTPPPPAFDRLLRTSDDAKSPPAVEPSPSLHSSTTPPVSAGRDSPPHPPSRAETRGRRNGSSYRGDEEDGRRNGGSVGSSAEDISRQAQLLTELSKKVINMKELRSITSQGIPDAPGVRSAVWKLLLGYLPPDRLLWPSELAKKRSQYKQFKEEVLMSPSEITRRLDNSRDSSDNDKLTCESRCMLSRLEITHEDHPLSLGKASIWNKFFQDTDIIEQIDRDVKRTHPDLHFFSGDSSLAKSTQDAMKNLLIVFAKLNPGIRYVQGMNEILAPIFYVFRNDPDEENAAHAEADTFFCFVEILSGFRDHFCQQLDNSVVGIRSTITRLSLLLKEHDEELWRYLEITTKVNPQFYAFRWITLLLTQEFGFFDSLQIWDALLSDPEGPQETLLRICCAMLILVRRRLIAGDFTSNLKLLQHYPPTNIRHLLYVAAKLRSKSLV